MINHIKGEVRFTSKFSVPHSSRNSRIGFAADPTVMYDMSAKFFTSPQAFEKRREKHPLKLYQLQEKASTRKEHIRPQNMELRNGVRWKERN